MQAIYVYLLPPLDSEGFLSKYNLFYSTWQSALDILSTQCKFAEFNLI